MTEKKNNGEAMPRRYTHKTLAGIEDAISASIDLLLYSNELATRLQEYVKDLQRFQAGDRDDLKSISERMLSDAERYQSLTTHRAEDLNEILRLLRRGPYAYNPDRPARPRLKIERSYRDNV